MRISKYKIHTHIFLQLLLAMLAFSVLGSKDSDGLAFSVRMRYAVSFYLVMNVLCYLNIYMLVPKFLLKGKYSKYVTSVVLLSLGAFLELIILSSKMLQAPHMPIWYSVINCLSSLISLGIVISSSSTLVMLSQWWSDRKRAEQLNHASVQTELDILKKQINPHFLFNTLNNVNVLLKREPDEASMILFKLEKLLRYQLKDSVRNSISLKSDIDFLRNYLELEQIRRDNLEYRLTVSGETENVLLPPLLFITFVENAVKHNCHSAKNAYVYVSFDIKDNVVSFLCENSKSDKEIESSRTPNSGLGLKNIRRRLELLFPDTHMLEIQDEEDMYRVKLIIEL